MLVILRRRGMAIQIGANVTITVLEVHEGRVNWESTLQMKFMYAEKNFCRLPIAFILVSSSMIH